MMALEPFSEPAAHRDDRLFRGFFIHIPRTGGTTIHAPFAKAGGYYLGHVTARTAKTSWPDGEWEKTPSFAFVRNPWDRAVSWFYGVSRGTMALPFQVVRERFQAWLEVNGKRYHGDTYFPVREYLCGGPTGRVPLVNFVGKFEDFDLCYREMFRIMDGVSPAREWKNVSTNRDLDGKPPYQDYYDPRSRGLIEGLCWWEIERFRYEFGG